MDCCHICYEDFADFDPPLKIEVQLNEERILSKLCINCITRTKKYRVDEYIQSIIKETCTASIRRMVNGPFVYKMTEDMTGFGDIITEIWVNDVPIGSDLTSEKYTDEELNEIINGLIMLREYMDDPPVLLVEKTELFERFER
jgi:hypothetical protein